MKETITVLHTYEQKNVLTPLSSLSIELSLGEEAEIYGVTKIEDYKRKKCVKRSERCATHARSPGEENQTRKSLGGGPGEKNFGFEFGKSRKILPKRETADGNSQHKQSPSWKPTQHVHLRWFKTAEKDKLPGKTDGKK